MIDRRRPLRASGPRPVKKPRISGLLGQILILGLAIALVSVHLTTPAVSFTASVIDRPSNADVTADVSGLIALDTPTAVTVGETQPLTTVTNHAGHAMTVTVWLDGDSTQSGSLSVDGIGSDASVSFLLPAGASRTIDFHAKATVPPGDVSFSVQADGGGLFSTLPARVVSLVSGDDGRVHAISHIAFCAATPTETTVTLTHVEFKDAEAEPIGLSWSAPDAISTVVVKAGTTIENFAGGTAGTVRVGEGVVGSGDQTAAQSCPSGEYKIVKFEWNGSAFVAESDEDAHETETDDDEEEHE